MFEKEIRYTDTGERIKPGDKVIIEFVYPENSIMSEELIKY